MEWVDAIPGVILGATVIWLIVHVVNQWRGMPRNKGPMFWISLMLLAMIPITWAAILLTLSLAIRFK